MKKVILSLILFISCLSASSKDSDYLFIDCYAPSCPPCKVLSPKFDQFAKKFASVGDFQKVDVTQNPELRETYKVTAVPTLLVFKDGVLVDRYSGLYTILDYFDSFRE